jgi:hypothetical protein
MKRDLIKTIHVDRANFNHIASSGRINGTLLIEIERVMAEHAQKQSTELLKALKGLLNDFKSHIGECDCEPQQAGYIGVAEEAIKKATT